LRKYQEIVARILSTYIQVIIAIVSDSEKVYVINSHSFMDIFWYVIDFIYMFIIV